MATRTSVRARPLDITRQLVIVRDFAELDNVEGVEKLLEQVRGRREKRPARRGQRPAPPFRS